MSILSDVFGYLVWIVGSIIIIIICYFLFLLRLVLMGRHKCEVTAYLSSQMQCELVNCYTVYFMRINLISFETYIFM